MQIFNVKKNITSSDYFFSHIRRFCQPIYDLRSYRKAYKNYPKVIHSKRINKYPIEAILQSGKIISIKNISQLRIVTSALENDCDIQNDLIVIKKKGFPEVKLYDGIENGDIRASFFEEQYRWLPVEEKEVIDIGTNIADSAIYFALRGAKKVIAIEPAPKNFQSAKKNIELNGLSNKIQLLMVGCSDKVGSVSIDTEKSGVSYSLENDEKQEIAIPLTTLNDILKMIKTFPCILKMDCEGCEYDSILASSKETLRNFSHIQLEYHFGYKNLKTKLEDSGFDVIVTRPRIGLPLSQEEKKSFFGYIFAKRKSKFEN
ncbi:MAG: FkbM family methyltransferase [Nitrosopumilaceae archaeon]